jgi:hypothetical protein
MEKYSRNNPEWEFVNITEIPIIAGRSNCVLDNTKAASIMNMRDEQEILEEVLND